VLTLGVAASIAANVLHARPNLISQLIAAWPPLALLLTVELISRVPAHRRSLAVLRLLATAAIAGIAAWVSYWHMKGVAARYGETDAAASYLLPISVDGLVVVASISLVEIAGRIRTSRTDPDPASTRTEEPTAGPHQPPLTQPPAVPDPAPVADRQAPVEAPPGLRTDAAGTQQPPGEAPSGDEDRATGSAPRHDEQTTAPGDDAADGQRSDDDDEAAAEEDAVPPETAAAVAFWFRRDPSMHPAEVAAKIGRSERTVRRYWPPTSQRAINGHETRRLADGLHTP
jgi:hypothetical protein